MTRIADLLDLPRRRRRPAVGGGVQRRGGLPLPADRGRPRGDLRRRAGGRGGARASTPTRWSRSRSAASATASTGRSPTASSPASMILTDVDDLVAEPVSRVIIRDPDATADDFVDAGRAARPARHRLRRRLDRLARPRPGRRLQGLRPRATSPSELGVDAGRRAGDRRRPQRHRDAAAGPAAAWPWARRSRRCRTPPTHVTDTVDDDGAAVELDRWFRVTTCPRASSTTERLRLPLCHRRRRRPTCAPGAGGATGTPTTRARTTSTPPRMCARRATRGGRGTSCCDGQAVVGSIGFFGPPPGRRRRRRPRSATAWCEAARGSGLATEALRGLLGETDAAGVRLRASVAAGQRGQPPGARQLRVHRAARQQRGRRAGAWPARCRAVTCRRRGWSPPTSTAPCAHRRHRLRPHPRGARPPRRARRPGGLRDRPAAALDGRPVAGGRQARPGDRLQRRDRLRRRAPTGSASVARDRGRPPGCAAGRGDPRGRARGGVRRRVRGRASRREPGVPRAAPRSPRAARSAALGRAVDRRRRSSCWCRHEDADPDDCSATWSRRGRRRRDADLVRRPGWSRSAPPASPRRPRWRALAERARRRRGRRGRLRRHAQRPADARAGPARRTPWPTRTRPSSPRPTTWRPANDDDGVAGAGWAVRPVICDDGAGVRRRPVDASCSAARRSPAPALVADRAAAGAGRAPACTPAIARTAARPPTSSSAAW